MKDKVFSCNENRGNKMVIVSSIDEVIITTLSKEMRCELVMVLDKEQIKEAIDHLTLLSKSL